MNPDDDVLAKKTDDDAIIAECMDRMRLSMDADGENRTNGLDDLAFLKGDQWDERIKQQRAMDGRPCLTINKLPTSLHQVTNSTPPTPLCPQVCCALSQIAKHSVDLAEVVVGAEIFPKILTCLKFPDEFVKKHSATVVRGSGVFCCGHDVKLNAYTVSVRG